jgi:hypothetical protein
VMDVGAPSTVADLADVLDADRCARDVARGAVRRRNQAA